MTSCTDQGSTHPRIPPIPQKIYPGHGAVIEDEPVKTIEEYIHHPIPVSKYDREALLDDVTAPKRVFRNRQPVNRNMRDRQGGGNSNNRRRPPRKN